MAGTRVARDLENRNALWGGLSCCNVLFASSSLPLISSVSFYLLRDSWFIPRSGWRQASFWNQEKKGMKENKDGLYNSDQPVEMGCEGDNFDDPVKSSGGAIVMSILVSSCWVMVMMYQFIQTASRNEYLLHHNIQKKRKFIWSTSKVLRVLLVCTIGLNSIKKKKKQLSFFGYI